MRRTEEAGTTSAMSKKCILPLGDSITSFKPPNTARWSAKHARDIDGDSWRYALWKKLIDHRPSIEYGFVGSMKEEAFGNEIEDYKGRKFPRHHEGHWGWRADEILNGRGGAASQRLVQWQRRYTCQPECVLLMLGTNDAWKGQTPASTVVELKRIMALLQDGNANVEILVANLIPSCAVRNKKKLKSTSMAIDAAFGKSAFLRSSSATYLNMTGTPNTKSLLLNFSRIHLVDFFHLANFTQEHDTYDRCHPNIGGQKKMAVKWFDAMQKSCPKVFLSPSEQSAGLLSSNSKNFLSGQDPAEGATRLTSTVAPAASSNGTYLEKDAGVSGDSLVGGNMLVVVGILAALAIAYLFWSLVVKQWLQKSREQRAFAEDGFSEGGSQPQRLGKAQNPLE